MFNPKYHTKYLIISSSILFTSCALFGPKSATEVQELVDQSEFEKAYIAYQKLPPEEQQNFDLENLEKQKKKFIKSSLGESKALAKNNEFLQAESILEEALKNTNDDGLAEALANIQVQKSKYIEEKTLRYDLDKGKFLIDETTHLETLEKALAGDTDFERTKSIHLEEKERISKALGSYGLELVNVGNTQEAKQYLATASKLSGETEYKSTLSKIYTQEKKAAERRKARKNAKLQDEISELQEKFNQELKEKNFVAAQESLDKLENYKNISTSWMNKAKNSYSKAVSDYVDDQYQKGKIYYTRREIDKALVYWNNALKLDPENKQVKEYVDRARIFQKSLKELKSQ